MKKNSKIWTRVFKIITKASRHMCSLYAYITSLQLNKISNFFVMKYNLPTNWLFLLSLETRRKYVCYYSFLRRFISKFMYDTLVYFAFSICIYIVIALLNNCPMHGEFPSDARLKMKAREKIIYKGELNVFSTKIFENYD